MASGKKAKKPKGKTLALNEFLQETAGTIPVQPIRKSNINWADEVEDYDGYEPRKTINVVLPTAPKASRDFDDILEKVPNDPPYCAYLSNLPYDVDEEDISLFFKDMKIANMRIPKDDRSGESKSKGFGYVEFEDRESLVNALVLPETTLKNRRMRIELASNMDNDRRRGGGRMDMGRDRGERMETFGDWRSGPRTETNDNDRRGGGGGGGGGGGFSRDRDRDGGGSFTRDNMRGGEREERSFTRDNMRDNRDFGRDRDRDSSRDKFRSSARDRDGEDNKPGAWRDGDRTNRDQDRDRGFTRDRGNFRDSDRGSRFDDDRRGGGFGRRYDNDRDRDRNDGFSRGGGRDDKDSEHTSSEPRERPKLMLAPRTKPTETAPVKSETVPSASIFGSAKPVDTSQREREIEEKLAKGYSEKPRETSSDRRPHDSENADKKKEIERSRPPVRVDRSPQKENDNKDGQPPARRNYDDKKGAYRTEQRSPDKADNKPKSEKSDKPRREEKRDKPEKEMPKVVDTEPPNFAANNKFAFLQTDDNSD